MPINKLKIKQITSGSVISGKTILSDGDGNFNIDYPQIAKLNSVPSTANGGDLFFYTVDGSIYKFDAVRNKWLTISTVTLTLGRVNVYNNVNTYLDINGVTQSSNTGFIMPKNGTIKRISIDNTTTLNANRTLEIRVNNSSTQKATITIQAGSKSAYINDANVDFLYNDRLQGIILANNTDDLINVIVIIEVSYAPI
jgi:hypothetical protein